jgi:hypothetical protein
LAEKFPGFAVFDGNDPVQKLERRAGQPGDFSFAVEDFVAVAEGVGGFADGEGGDAVGGEEGGLCRRLRVES